MVVALRSLSLLVGEEKTLLSQLNDIIDIPSKG